jgi:hypothetical protein
MLGSPTTGKNIEGLTLPSSQIRKTLLPTMAEIVFLWRIASLYPYYPSKSHKQKQVAENKFFLKVFFLDF